MDTGIEGLGITGALSEVQVLGCQHRLGCHEVRIHPLPPSGQRTTMEDHLDTEVVGVGKDIFVELHHLLLVPAEEVHLDAQDAVLLHPRHLLPAWTALVHLVLRTLRGIVPRAVRVIPQEQSYALLLAVAGQLLHLLITDLRIPEGIHEHTAEAHGSREVDIAFLLVEVTAGIHADDPRPRTLAVGIVLRSLVLRRHKVVGDGCLCDGSQRGTDGDGAPGRQGRQSHQRTDAPRAIHLFGQGEANLVLTILHVLQPTAHITTIGTRLGEEHPSLGRLEQTGEGIAEAPAVLSHRVVGGIAGLVARGRPGKARHRLHLRTKERGGTLRQHITAGLDLHDTRHRLTSTHPFRIDLITVGHVTAGHAEDHVESLTAILLKTAHTLRCQHLHMTLFGGLQTVLVLILAHIT